MEHPTVIKQPHTHTRTLPLADLGTQLNKQRLNIAPLDIGTYWAGKNQFKGFLVLAFHGEIVLDNGTIFKGAVAG